MATIDPHDGSVVNDQVAAFRDALMTELTAVLERTSKFLDPHSPVHSSNIMRTFWKGKVNGLVDKLEAVVITAADRTRAQLQSHVDTRPALIADAFEIPSPVELFAEMYLRSRRGFLLDLGNGVWNIVRGELVDGMNDGEGIGELRSRVMSVADVARPRAERIARTEVVGATNAGAIEQVRASKLDATKTWLATNDSRTRESHRDVNGTTVPLDETFLVGGVRMDRPHDPTAPADEVIQCRCTLTFEIADDTVIAAAFGKPDQQRDYHGRWGKGGPGSGSDDTADEPPVKGTKALKVAEYTDVVDKHKDTLEEYKLADNGWRANALLRSKKDDEYYPASAEDHAQANDLIKRMDGAFADTPTLKQPIEVYRGVDAINNVFGDKKLAAGTTFTDKGFTSTTSKKSVADSYGYSDYSGLPGGTVTIEVPKGQKALTIDNGKVAGRTIIDFKGREVPAYPEDIIPEVLLPKNTKFEVVSDSGPATANRGRKLRIRVVS